MKRLLFLPLVMVLLTAAQCGGRPEFAKPPADKLVCPNEPDPPVGVGPGGTVTDEENGTYLKDLRGAWAGCFSDVEWLRTWFKNLND